MKTSGRIRSMQITLLFCLAASLAVASYAQGSRTVRLLGRFHQYPAYSGVWGYADGQGREYALIGTRNGTSIIDITDPSNPVESAFIPGPPSVWHEVSTYSTYAYTTTEAGGGVQIIDLSDLPRSASLVNVYNATVNNAHTLFIDQDGGFAYIDGATGPPSNSRGGMNFLDLNADPMNPVQAGVYNTRYVHDVYVRDNIAYAAEINNRQFSIIDVSDKTNPRVLAVKSYPGGFTHNVSVTDDGSYLLTTDEILNGGHLRVWDISDLSNISQVGEYSTHPRATIHNVYMLGDFAYASYYAEGLRVIDMTDPTLPVEAGYYDTHPEWVNGFRGAWGCYPYLPSGNILISDIQTGLWIFSFDGTYAGRLRGQVTASGTQQPVAGATVTLQGNNFPVTTDSNGAYGIGYIPDTYRLTVSRPGYQTFEANVTLISGQTINFDVTLRPN